MNTTQITTMTQHIITKTITITLGILLREMETLAAIMILTLLHRQSSVSNMSYINSLNSNNSSSVKNILSVMPQRL